MLVDQPPAYGAQLNVPQPPVTPAQIPALNPQPLAVAVHPQHIVPQAAIAAAPVPVAQVIPAANQPPAVNPPARPVVPMTPADNPVLASVLYNAISQENKAGNPSLTMDDLRNVMISQGRSAQASRGRSTHFDPTNRFPHQ